MVLGSSGIGCSAREGSKLLTGSGFGLTTLSNYWFFMHGRLTPSSGYAGVAYNLVAVKGRAPNFAGIALAPAE